MTSRLRVGDIVRLRNSRGCTYTVTHVYPTYWNEKESVIVKSNNSGFICQRRKSEDYVLLKGVGEVRDTKKKYVVAFKGTYYITGTIPSGASEVYELGRKLFKKEEWV